MINRTLYPWQMMQWRYIETLLNTKRLPHALLLTGMKGIGKFAFAEILAQKLLCHSNDSIEIAKTTGFACGECKPCQLILAETHPDLKIVTPEEKSDVIKIDQIRAVIEFFTFTALQNSYKITIIHLAEAMNHAAANALLKTLEEPPLHNNLIILVSDQPALLLPTIRSRCQQINFTLPLWQDAIAWLVSQDSENKKHHHLALALAEGAPIYALSLLRTNKIADAERLLGDLTMLSNNKVDPIKVASHWQSGDAKEFFKLLLILLAQIIQQKLGNTPTFAIPAMKPNSDVAQFFSFLDFVFEQSRVIHNKVNLNYQMLLETLFHKWVCIN